MLTTYITQPFDETNSSGTGLYVKLEVRQYGETYLIITNDKDVNAQIRLYNREVKDLKMAFSTALDILNSM